MADEHVVTDWRLFLSSLPDVPLYDTSQHPVNPTCTIVWGLDSPLSYLHDVDGMELLDRAKDVWEANGHPQMWVTSGIGTAPWYVAATVTTKVRKGKIGA